MTIRCCSECCDIPSRTWNVDCWKLPFQASLNCLTDGSCFNFIMPNRVYNGLSIEGDNGPLPQLILLFRVIQSHSFLFQQYLSSTSYSSYSCLPHPSQKLFLCVLPNKLPECQSQSLSAGSSSATNALGSNS